MKKCDLFTVLNSQSKRLEQPNGLSNLLVSAGGMPNHTKKDLRAYLSIVSDLIREALNKQEAIHHEVTQLAIVSNSVVGIR
jgi:hypothetical protein